MKQQVSRLSPHQNGKVFGVLFAVLSLIVVVPVFLLASMTVPVPKACRSGRSSSRPSST